MSVRLVYAMMQQNRLQSVRRNLERVLPHVDNVVIVDNGSTDGTREWLRTLAPKVILIERQWDDSFVGARNAYLRAIDDIAEDPTVICVADDDELYSDDLLQDLRGIAEEAYYDDINLLRIRSRSVETDWKGEECWSQMDAWHKPLIMVWERGLRYQGIGQSEVHEDLVVPSGRRERILQDRGRFYYCVEGTTPILRADLIWSEAQYVGPGDEVIGFDEWPLLGSQGPKLRRAVVLANNPVIADCLEIETDRGTVIVSEGHWWWARSSLDPQPPGQAGRAFQWIPSRALKPGHTIAFLVKPWKQDIGYEAGWLAGILDGEGSVSGHRVSFSQKPGPVFERTLAGFQARGYQPYVHLSRFGRPEGQEIMQVVLGRMVDSLHALGSLRPMRLLQKSATIWEDRQFWGKGWTPATVLAVRPTGRLKVYPIETSTGTFIANGLLGHNSHIKKHGEIWLRGTRNFFAGGGGPNLGELNPLWRPFRQLVADCTANAVATADRYVEYLQRGEVSSEVLAFFRKYRLLGTRFDPTPSMWPQWPDGTSEVREGFLAYYVFLHPERMSLDVIDADRAYCDYRKEVKIIWGPKAPTWADAVS